MYLSRGAYKNIHIPVIKTTRATATKLELILSCLFNREFAIGIKPEEQITDGFYDPGWKSEKMANKHDHRNKHWP